jgi:hypothetical protein
MTEREEIRRERRLVRMLRAAEELAVSGEDGHLTIMRFTTGWKIMLGTPEMTVEFTGLDCEITGGGYSELRRLKSFESLEAALEDFMPAEMPSVECE